MKKIIAMLLCVAMVAAFGASAFAAGPFEVVVTGKSTYQAIYEDTVAKAKAAAASASALSQYAAELAKAQKALAGAKKTLAAVKGDAVGAAQTAVNYAVATAYEVAAHSLYLEATKAIADFYYDFALGLVDGDVTALPDTLPAEYEISLP